MILNGHFLCISHFLFFFIQQIVNILYKVKRCDLFACLPFIFLPLSLSFCLQDFPLLRLDDVVDDQSNIVGFSMLNSSHPFYLEFIRSLNLSWREGCDISPYPGPAVRETLTYTCSVFTCTHVPGLHLAFSSNGKPGSCSRSRGLAKPDFPR